MMKRMLGFWAGCCAAAGVLINPDSGINIDALNRTAQDRLRQPDALLGGVAAEGGLSLNVESNMASLSLFMLR
jgi:hypothetical protein